MKTISSELQDHLNQEVTTLCTCFSIKRRDGRFFRFTDHVNDLVFEGNTYYSDTGYTRTAISSKRDMSVDNLQIEGFFNEGQITGDDLAAGLFDFSEVKIFIVNYEDLTQGRVALKRGHLGEVQHMQSSRFYAELRGLSQRLQQTIGVLAQATCRADLGDKQCRFPIQPPVVLRGTTYNVGDFVRAQTGNPSAVFFNAAPLSNDFEQLSPWTTVSGAPEIVSVYNTFGPYQGSNFLHGNTTSSPSGFILRQDVDLTSIVGFSQNDLDNGYYKFNASIRMMKTRQFKRDAGRVRVEALDSNGQILAELWNTKYQYYLNYGVWNLHTISDAPIPANTTTIRYWIEAGSYPKTGITEFGFDDLRAEIVDNNGSTGSQAFYENRIYECTTAGVTGSVEPSPGYDTTIGNTTNDGSAVFTTREAFMRHAVVASVASKRVFTITVDTHTNSADDYYNGGAVFFETGNNAGQIMEIRDWVESSGTVTLFLEMPRIIQVGDKLRLFPGCDKRRETCRDKFAISGSTDFATGNVYNFDGEPDLPGPDAVLTYPDAK